MRCRWRVGSRGTYWLGVEVGGVVGAGAPSGLMTLRFQVPGWAPPPVVAVIFVLETT